jgi:hypothetical protein
VPCLNGLRMKIDKAGGVILSKPVRDRFGYSPEATPKSEQRLKLYTLMREQGIGKAELARRLHCHLP